MPKKPFLQDKAFDLNSSKQLLTIVCLEDQIRKHKQKITKNEKNIFVKSPEATDDPTYRSSYVKDTKFTHEIVGNGIVVSPKGLKSKFEHSKEGM